MPAPAPVHVGLDPSLRPWLPEVKYTLRTLLTIAGFPVDLRWAANDSPTEGWDLYYGEPREGPRAAISIHASQRAFDQAPWLPLRDVRYVDGLPLLDFGGDDLSGPAPGSAGLTIRNDLVFASFWLLTGAREPYYARDRHWLMRLEGEPIWDAGLLQRPAVSLYGALLRRALQQRGLQPMPLPCVPPRGGATWVFTHDVDYPEIVRAVECLRLLRRHGRRSPGPIGRILRGTSHFWMFPEWLSFERSLGARSAFYFMAHKGSLWKYALGTPDAFYDIRTPRFRTLFRQLTDAGCEIGLHTSYTAYRSVERIRQEKALLEDMAGVAVAGNRHHYVHLDPLAPHETLRRDEQAGLLYDASLLFNHYPGFRRGICHPYRPFHPGERRALDLVELPTCLMDDHFDRLVATNGIGDPEGHLLSLMDAARATGGAIVVDYHARGMNAEIYPRYGRWLADFTARHFDSGMAFPLPRDLAASYLAYERELDAHSVDRTDPSRISPVVNPASPRLEPVEFGPARVDELPELSELHARLLGNGALHRVSAATLGPRFLEEFFYGLNLDNPYLMVDVARHAGKVVGFSACTPDWTQVSRWMLRHRPLPALATLLRFALRRPLLTAHYLLSNSTFLGRRSPEAVRGVRAMFMLIAVTEECRSRAFKQRTGTWVARSLCERVEAVLRAHGCRECWIVLGAGNHAVNELFRGRGAVLVARGRVQGVWSNHYLMPLVPVRPTGALGGDDLVDSPGPASTPRGETTGPDLSASPGP